MRAQRVSLSLVLVLAVGACENMGSGEPPLTREAIEAIRSQQRAFVAAANANDAAAVASLRVERSVAYPPGHPMVIGRDSLQMYYASLPRAISFSVNEMEIAGTGVRAHNFGTWTGTFVVGTDTVTDAGKYAQLWYLRDTTWLIGFEIWNSDNPPAPPPPAPASGRD